MKVAVLFSGQGSQYPNMGKDFYEQYPYLQTHYEQASEILGYDLEDIIFSDNELLNNTLYTQPAILVTSLAIYEVLKKEYQIKPEVMSGFSLGEYSALCASGVFDFTDIVNLIKHRAELMENASVNTQGKMAAVIGMNQDKLLTLCKEISNDEEFVTIANYNCPNQLVVSGTATKVDELEQLALDNGARRYIKLNVSGGFHTKLMNQASDGIYQLVKKNDFKKPEVDVIMNATADYLAVEKLPIDMKNQINSPVLFEQSIRKILDTGVDTIIEIGPGKVLSGFVKKINRKLNIITIDQLNDLDKLQLESGV